MEQYISVKAGLFRGVFRIQVMSGQISQMPVNIYNRYGLPLLILRVVSFLCLAVKKMAGKPRKNCYEAACIATALSVIWQKYMHRKRMGMIRKDMRKRFWLKVAFLLR
ncbi:hypothetical protein CHD23_17870 [Salmonella enterica]|nr:hypothetical protein CHD23_17870 [Salmonella enterica]